MSSDIGHWTDTVVPRILDLVNIADQREILQSRSKATGSPAAWVISHQLSTAMPMLLNVVMRMKTLSKLEQRALAPELEQFLRQRGGESLAGFAHSNRQSVQLTPLPELPAAPRNKRELEQFVQELSAELGQCSKALSSVPYFLTDEIAHEVLAAEPMDSEFFETLQLPLPSVTVWVGKPLVFAEDFLATEDIVAQQVNSALRAILPEERESKSLELLGVAFLATKDGTVTPQATAFVRTSYGRADYEPVWGGLTAAVNIDLTQESVFTALAVNLLGVVAFEQWKAPERPPPDVTHLPASSPQFRKATGRCGNDQVLSLRTVRLADSNEDWVEKVATEASGRKITGYVSKRGHWRRSRIGPRATWDGQYRVNFIRRVEINPHLRPDSVSSPLFVPTSMGDGYKPYFEKRTLKVDRPGRSVQS